MRSHYTMDVPLAIGDVRNTIVAEYVWHPGEPAVLYGDQQQPEEPAHPEILRITWKEHPGAMLPKLFEDHCGSHIQNHHEPELGPDPDDARDARRDMALCDPDFAEVDWRW